MKIFVIIPCYKVTQHIAGVVDTLGPEVDQIIAVDDCCPDGSGAFIEKNISDPRLTVVYNKKNLGVGGAVLHGYTKAIQMGADICVKVDGDGQMDGSLIKTLVNPILKKKADYTKGNRFFSFYNVRSMPKKRLIGNMMLSFLTKLSSGYWSIFDPTNGFTAVHTNALRLISFDQISTRYFFETDMLIQLGNVRAKVLDMPMEAVYGDEVSGLSIKSIFGEFLTKHLKAIFRRLIYTYYMRDFSVASFHLPLGVLLLSGGGVIGSEAWIESIRSGIPATSGTVSLAMLPILLGVQFLLSFLSYDIQSEPSTALLDFWEP